ncbi:CMP-N-acetylneuraminate-beta-1,4-galactoside alpha-2,3-sialyltransferase-like isoform X1 [Lytechinus pictus]|uniref:CMP-N-acetylneuraminate-beta-1,4-galactoside alpha-2,3-sialyltransferase-like isoform X1 n=2 Tax=Lytechinus pictus TaxID=7653 RepID=UPI0030B9EA7F
MGRTMLRLLDRQAPSILRSLFYIILVCILVLAVDVMLLQYSKNSRSTNLFGYGDLGMPPRRSRPLDSDELEEDFRSRRRPMRHKVKADQGGPLPSLAVPINRDYFESSNITCRKGYSRRKLQELYGDRFDAEIPLFVDSGFLDRPNAVNLPMPFGFRDAERAILNILKHMPKTEVPDDIPQDSCLRCVVQGNGGIATRTRIGAVINNFDIVFRLNSAPTIGHERDVGRKTTFRMAYPESAFRRPEQYDPGWTFVVMMFKPLDLVWLETIIRGRKMNSGDGFWKKIPLSVPKPTKDFRIFNPEILLDTAKMMGFKIDEGKANKNIPTSGMLAIMMAVRLCDEVAVAGFGYDPNKPGAPLHYYDSLPMREIWRSWTHDIHHERGILRLFKQQGIILDLSGGIR